MASTEHALGPAHLFIRRREASGQTEPYYYLGTSVTAPEVTVEKLVSPVHIDLTGPAPYNRIYHGEVHTLTATLNVFDYMVYVALRARGTFGIGGIRRGDLDIYSGNLMTPFEDFELLLLYDPPYIPTWLAGRLYYSATPLRFRETTEHNRLLEVGVVIECSAIDLAWDTAAEVPVTPVSGQTVEIRSNLPEAPLPFTVPSAITIQSGPTSTQLKSGSFPTTLKGSSSSQGGGGKLDSGTVKVPPGRLETDNIPDRPASPIPVGFKVRCLYTEVPIDWLRPF